MATTPDFPVIFDQLKVILKPYEPRLSVTADGSEDYSLDTHQLGPNKKPMFFGAAVIKKNYVSFHLMPVYVHPELLEDISDTLRKRMQGKSCFNFKAWTKTRWPSCVSSPSAALRPFGRTDWCRISEQPDSFAVMFRVRRSNWDGSSRRRVDSDDDRAADRRNSNSEVTRHQSLCEIGFYIVSLALRQ